MHKKILNFAGGAVYIQNVDLINHHFVKCLTITTAVLLVLLDSKTEIPFVQ